VKWWTSGAQAELRGTLQISLKLQQHRTVANAGSAYLLLVLGHLHLFIAVSHTDVMKQKRNVTRTQCEQLLKNKSY